MKSSRKQRPHQSDPALLLHRALRKSKAAERVFNSLPASHQREYLAWIRGAKKAETRDARIEKTVLMLRDRAVRD